MKRTYITNMPDHVGAFSKASRCIADLGLNITRLSYNKAIDLHTAFIEAEGDEVNLEKATEKLREMGYLLAEEQRGEVLLVEFMLQDIPGCVNDAVELIDRYHFNISYISSRSVENGRHILKLGLFVEDPKKFSDFLNTASRMCPVRVIDYDRSGKILDNSIFYISFAGELASRVGLGAESRMDLALNANQIMQMLDDRNEPFHKTFDYIRGYSEILVQHRGDAFCPRITEHDFGPDVHLTLIEPPCGSNTCILRHQGKYLFIDTGYACYRQEMLKLLREMIPDFDTCNKSAIITHADLDHCGLLDLFPKVYMSEKSRISLTASRDAGDFREQNPIHAPHVRISKALSFYQPPNPDILEVIGGSDQRPSQPLESIGSWQFGDLFFELYESQGGHLPGEIVLVERKHRLVFTGDIFINIKELIKPQADHNRFAPYLMTSVDTDPALCALQRKALPSILGSGIWHVFGGHGPRKEMTID